MAIDFGLKRTGLAISDPLRMIANGLDTVESTKLMDCLRQIEEQHGFDVIVVGEPRQMSGEASDIEGNIKMFIKALNDVFPNKAIARHDERLTSKMAFDTMIASGISKKQRAKKENVDKISATLILQEYLNQQQQ